MIKFKQLSILLLTLTLLAACSSKENENPHWVINEVMVQNETNYMDNFGKRSGWIEIFNNTSKTQDLGGRYLTNDKNNPKKYPIPRGDVNTKVSPYQHVLFFADNEPFNGTFHINFEFDSTKENYIALYDNDGKTLLDEIIIPASIPADRTYGYAKDGIKYDESGSYTGQLLERVTPKGNNAILEENPKVVDLSVNDKFGGLITLTSMLVVFTSLILLYFAFKFTGNVAKKVSHKRVAHSGKLSAARSETHLSGEILAAISAAIVELKEDQHDIESTILTIRQVKRNYSPWSSKIYSLRELPQKK